MVCRLQGMLETYLIIGTSLPFLDPRETLVASAMHREVVPPSLLLGDFSDPLALAVSSGPV